MPKTQAFRLPAPIFRQESQIEYTFFENFPAILAELISAPARHSGRLGTHYGMSGGACLRSSPTLRSFWLTLRDVRRCISSLQPDTPVVLAHTPGCQAVPVSAPARHSGRFGPAGTRSSLYLQPPSPLVLPTVCREERATPGGSGGTPCSSGFFAQSVRWLMPFQSKIGVVRNFFQIGDK